jgi:hypothetical protein
MKPLVILAVLLAASSAAAQTLRQAPPPQPAPLQQQPLILNPDTWNVGRSATAPASPFAPGSPSAAQPSSGPTFRPSIGTQPTPDAMPPDRRQEYIPTLRLKVPL